MTASASASSMPESRESSSATASCCSTTVSSYSASALICSASASICSAIPNRNSDYDSNLSPDSRLFISPSKCFDFSVRSWLRRDWLAWTHWLFLHSKTFQHWWWTILKLISFKMICTLDFAKFIPNFKFQAFNLILIKKILIFF